MKTDRRTKLTLAVNSSVIRKAKSYAASHKTSVSSLVESYLRSLTESDSMSAGVEDSVLPPITRRLHGAARLPDGIDSDQLKWEYLREKYLRE
jgi:hypothetical protein